VHLRAAALAIVPVAAALAGGGSAEARVAPVIRHAAFTPSDVGATTSSNWSGYAVADAGSGATTAFSDVAGSWIQPAGSCAAGGAAYAAFWVGLGGYSESSRALEQTGTETDCGFDGTPRYSAWYELLPAPPVTLKLVVRPGDTIAAAVAVRGTAVTFKIRNVTRHKVFTKRLRMRAPDRSSAEWIAEAPSSCGITGCQTLPLANFGTVAFNAATAIGAGHHGTISDPAWAATAVTLHGGGSDSARGRFLGNSPAADAIPSSLGSDGTSFSVAWQQQQQ
jgi:Peptidase A4 family